MDIFGTIHLGNVETKEFMAINPFPAVFSDSMIMIKGELRKAIHDRFKAENFRKKQGRDFMSSDRHTVITFQSFPFQVGQKIYIKDGPRHGDWEVIGITDRKVTFRCPVSHREFTWDRFCYFLEKEENSPWPHPD